MPLIENSDSRSLIIFKKKLRGKLRGEKRQFWLAGYSNLAHA